MKEVTKITFPKIGILIIFVILFTIFYFSGIVSLPKKALPFQLCGGSMPNAKECLLGYCQYKTICEGCGGICVLK